MNAHTDLINNLSKQSKSKQNLIISPENNPLLRRNKQLENENSNLIKEIEELKKSLVNINQIEHKNFENKINHTEKIDIQLNAKIKELENHNANLLNQIDDLKMKIEILSKNLIDNEDESKNKIDFKKSNPLASNNNTQEGNGIRLSPFDIDNESLKTRLEYCAAPTKKGIALLLELKAKTKEDWIHVPNSTLNKVMEPKYIKVFREEGVALGFFNVKTDEIPENKRIGFFYQLNYT